MNTSPRIGESSLLVRSCFSTIDQQETIHEVNANAIDFREHFISTDLAKHTCKQNKQRFCAGRRTQERTQTRTKYDK